MNTRTQLVGLTLINSYIVQDRTGRTFRDVLAEYDSLEISFLLYAMHRSRFTDDTRMGTCLTEMVIIQNTVEIAPRDLYRSLKHCGYRPVGWVGALVFGAQHPSASLEHAPVAIGGKPFIAKWPNKPKQARFMQVRQEHQGVQETDLELGVDLPDPRTGLWRAKTNFLVTPLRR